MRRFYFAPRFLVFLMLAFAPMLLSGCDVGGQASCKEECSVDDDCGDGLGCFELSTGQVCVPYECSACFDGGQRCNWNEGYDQDEMFVCNFAECSTY